MWIAHLTALEPYRPIFIGLTLLFLTLAFRKTYLAHRVCADGDSCADDRVLKRQRVLFWLVTVPLVLLLAFPWYASLLF
jgi:mercuric ion transport protein